MKWMLMTLTLTLTLLTLCFCCLLSACGCTQNIAFDVSIKDPTGKAVAGATVRVSCQDLAGGDHAATGMSDGNGAATVRVVAPSRDCPKDGRYISEYFGACTLTVERQGLQPATRTLLGTEIDAIDTHDEAGHHAKIDFVLAP